MRTWWCSRCSKGVLKNQRLQRAKSKGWVCPDCQTGLPRLPIMVIEEEETQQEILIGRLRA